MSVDHYAQIQVKLKYELRTEVSLPCPASTNTTAGILGIL